VSNGNMGMSDPAILLVDVLRILRTRKPRSKGEACAINAVYIYCFGYTKDVAPLRVTALEFRAWLKNGHAQRDIRNLGVYGVAIWEALLDEVMPELDKTTRETPGQHYDAVLTVTTPVIAEFRSSINGEIYAFPVMAWAVINETEMHSSAVRQETRVVGLMAVPRYTGLFLVEDYDDDEFLGYTYTT